MLEIYLTLEALAIVLNSVFAYVVWYRSNVNTNIKYLLFNLIGANIAITILCICWDLTSTLNIPANRAICIANFIMFPACLYTTLGTIAIISLERLFAIRSPLFYQRAFMIRYKCLTPLAISFTAFCLSLLALPDYLHNESGHCIPSDIYPPYSVIFVATICSVLLFLNIVLFGLIIWSLICYTNTPQLSSSSRKPKALRASTIALASAVFYFLTLSPGIVFLFWNSANECDDLCLVTNAYSQASNVLINVLTLGDPLIYFFSFIPCRSSKVDPGQSATRELAAGNNNQPRSQVFNLQPKCFRTTNGEETPSSSFQPRSPTV